MKKILLFGAGLSASTLIKYLLERSVAESWHLDVVDQDPDLIQAKIGSIKIYQGKFGYITTIRISLQIDLHYNLTLF